MERRLAAVLAADVVGYSRLMGDDETGTLAELQRHRVGLFDPKAKQHKWPHREVDGRRHADGVRQCR